MQPKLIISINTAWNIANFRAGLIGALQHAGYEVVAVAPPDEAVGRIEAMGCRFVPLAMDNKGTNPWRDLMLYRRFRRILAQERPAAFLGYTIKPNVYGTLAARSLGIPTINNVSGLGTAFIRTSWLTKVVERLYRAALYRSNLVLFQNGDDQALFLDRNLVHPDRTDLVPGSGIDLAAFAPQPSPPRPAQTPLVMLLIARLLYDKGVGEFAEAARLLKQQGIAVDCRLLGFLDVVNKTAVSAATVQEWVNQGIVTYCGSAEDVRPHIAAADVVVLPSYREGTPRSLLEAAAMGKPLIATDVPGCREVIEPGISGLLCRPRDAADLARVMAEMATMPADERAAMGAAGRARMVAKFDETLVIRRYLQALESIIPRPASARAASALL